MKTFRPAELQRYAHNKVAAMYGVSRQTLYRWLKPIADELGKRHGNRYSIEQVKVIFARFGVPMIAVIADAAAQASG